MKWKYQEILRAFKKGQNYQLFNDSNHGLEREFLRCDKEGNISMKAHPKALGSTLTNPYITTDFSEAQVELVTPVFKREEQATLFLKQLHCFTAKHTPGELLWPLSMPCRLPRDSKIPLAQYGKSRGGQKRTDYRLGLGERYGRKMQTVSGTHYNFSFDDKLWEFLYEEFGPRNKKGKQKQTFQDFRSRAYFHLIRNFLKMSWLNTYLFGAAPAIDKSYLKKRPRPPKPLKKFDRHSYYGPHATSLRMSNLGYYSKVQAQLAISYNSLPQYLADLHSAVTTPSPRYKKLKGLNQNKLQIENEHYSRIRPKCPPKTNERAIEALANRGVQYVEVRAVDINPYQPVGIAKHQLRFIHMLLIYSLFQPSPRLSDKQHKEITVNQNLVAMEGRKPGLILQKNGKAIGLEKWAQQILTDLKSISKLLDKNFSNERYSASLEMQLEKLKDPERLSSARILREMAENKQSYLEHGLALARQHQETYCIKGCPKQRVDHFVETAAKSHQDQEMVELMEETFLKGYEDMELSTQCLIREALKRKVKVEILDRKENLIRLTKGRRVEYVQQASLTRHNSEVGYFLLGNKAVHKKILQEHGISAPQGDLFSNLEHALEEYPRFQNLNLVVKPNLSNYGIAINFVPPLSPRKYKRSLQNAFEHGDSVIVEEFIEGLEYRFLVIDYKCVAVLHRRAANVLGDGKQTIAELVQEKVSDPRNYKFLGKLNLGPTELGELRRQKLNSNSIPKKGQRVFLRKNSNISTGGDPIDFTDQIDVSYKRIAEKAAKAANAKICGLDMIIKNPKKSSIVSKYSIIELNYNPTLQMHIYVMGGKPRDVVTPILKLLGF
jgi:glutamate--cysteine ligase